MKKDINWTRILHITGVVLLVAGAIDPLEGSVLILVGSAMLALSLYLKKDQQWKLFGYLLLAIVIGVGALFYLSSLGGFGGTSALSWWWGLFIVPYPLAWLVAIIFLIRRATRKKKLAGT
ncbi:MAG: hypothetical protein KKD74_11385 [Bacteroidetes bacterium]|nr:hypothetical protein [Bacteroidota bacterium]